MLTDAQHDKLEILPDKCRVVGFDRGPLVERTEGSKIVCVSPKGQLVPATRDAISHIEGRRAGLRCVRPVSILVERDV